MAIVPSLSKDVFQPGDISLTPFGVGVIVEVQNDVYTLRMWRVPGQSIGSAARAILQPSMLQRKLPAAPGMVALLDDQSRVLVHCYFRESDSFLVSQLEQQPQIDAQMLPLSRRHGSSTILLETSNLYKVVPASRVCQAPAAKFYPLLETLLHRAEEAAIAATQMVQDERTHRVVQQTKDVIQQLTPKSADRMMVVMDPNVLPEINNEEVQRVWSLVKDSELTELLQNCQSRLQQLLPQDISQATRQALEKSGIRIETTNVSMIESSRQAALAAVEQFLKEARVDLDVEQVRGQLSNHFSQAFDALAQAAKSDPSLQAAFESVQQKTSEWQEATGRLMQTRSAGLFFEGAGRLQARATALFQQGQLQWAGEIGSKLTKSFTEGDAALARLKSIELGDVIKDRLVEAIEIRSEAHGGLDGIIAGALATVQDNGKAGGNQLQKLFADLQANATTTTLNAHETLLSVLSSRSVYRDVALLRLEIVFCALDHHLSDSLSPEEIASIAQGAGGTAKLFEPIAKKAMSQIDKQLDAAESNVSDETVLEVLKRVRKIMRGDLTLNSVMDELIAILDDDKVVAAGETIVQRSEHVLDAIEGASRHQVVDDAIKLAEKAGITKDSVMRELEKLDMKDLMDTAGSAMTDERARRKLLSSATDTALDFVLRILPSMPVPPFEGVKDGLLYHISNLSMEGFKVRKEDIQIELAGMRATRRVSSLHPTLLNQALDGSQRGDSFEIEEVRKGVNATELLIIDIRRITAKLDGASWSFEQTYMPYLKGQGLADVELSGGAIRLQFELRRRRKEAKKEDWEPVLCLHGRSCSIAEVDLTLQGDGRLTWVLNKLASIFKGPLRDYVVRTIVTVLTNRSGWILERLNGALSLYWDLILRTAKLSLDDLAEATDEVVVREDLSKRHRFVELVWRERLPLGMNLLMNDESGHLKVVDFPRGSQARAVCEKRNLQPAFFKGARIVAVNGTQYDDQDDLFDALRDPSRPKTVRFELAETEEAERIRKFVEGDIQITNGDTKGEERLLHLQNVVFSEPGELGIEFGSSLDNFGLAVRGFIMGDDGIVHAAERSGKIKVGDILVSINDKCVVCCDEDAPARTARLLESAVHHRPLKMTFVPPYLHAVQLERPVPLANGIDGDGGPEELVLDEQSFAGTRRIVITGCVDVCGKVESSGIFIGDHLVFVNGIPVGAGCRWLGVPDRPTIEDISTLLNDDNSYPMGLTFARPRQRDSRGWSSVERDSPLADDEADTMCVTIDNREQLGCVFTYNESHDIVVSDLHSIVGIFQRTLKKLQGHTKIALAIESINGQFVPSYATKDMVMNAIARSWKTDGRSELWVCDDSLKRWIQEHVTQSQQWAKPR